MPFRTFLESRARNRMPATGRRADAWLRLVRLPNLFTVPGDPLAGFVLAGGLTNGEVSPWRVLPAVAICLLIYAAGLILNDLHDLEADRRNRPERPLPAGTVTPFAAGRVMVALGGTAILIGVVSGGALPMTTLVLVGLVLAYNLVLKGNRVQAAAAMGLCRGFSLLVGAAAAGFSFAAWVAAIALTVAVAGVTLLAREENRTTTPGRFVFLPPGAFALGYLVCLVARLPGGAAALVSLLCACAAVAVALIPGRRHFGRSTRPAEMQAAIGIYLRALIPWQAALTALGGAAAAPGVALLALCALCATIAARRFAQS